MSDPTHTTSVPPRRTGDLVEKLVERLGAQLATSTVYGAAVDRDGVSVVPVAVARLGFGGGSGMDPRKQQEGEGGGGFGSVAPVGYIELKGGRTRFVPIVHPARMAALFLVAVLAALAIARPPRRSQRRGRLCRSK
jgi:uncharacterized spore protein YtfJ